MTALTQERDTRRRSGGRMSVPLAAAAKVLAGAIVCIDTAASGYGKKGATSTTLVPVGIAQETVDNTAGANGDLAVAVDREGWFKVANSASGDLITRADIGALCYLVDDQTVAKTNGGNTRSTAGRVRDIDADGDVWISFVQ